MPTYAASKGRSKFRKFLVWEFSPFQPFLALKDGLIERCNVELGATGSDLVFGPEKLKVRREAFR